MPYGRTYRYRRSYRRNYKKGKTLRKSNIFSNRSAKSQSYQIAALNRKVNRVYRTTKPEYKVVGITGAHHTSFYSSEATSPHIYVNYFDGPNAGTADYQRIGDKINSIAYHFYGTFEYHNTSTSGYHNSESAGAPMRVIILQRKVESTPESAVNLSDVLAITASSGDAYSCQVMSPFRDGVTEKYNILCDRKFTLTSARNQKLLHLKVKPKNMRFNGSNTNGLVVFIISAGLHYDANFTETVECYWSQKYVFTDA